MQEYFTFDDVLILPQFSEITSRKDVDLTTNLSGDVQLSLPIISANMDTITDDKMAIKMAKLGGMGILHRFSSIDDNVKSFKNVLNAFIRPFQVGVSIGLGNLEKERFHALYDTGARVFCIDVAHGAQLSVVEQAQYIKNAHVDITLIVGNFATNQTIQEFNDRCEGIVDSYKVGIGGGSVCSTRIKTGIGMPQLSAIFETSKNNGYTVIADGGIKTPGDAAKALAMGANAIMIGGMLAGTEETPGEVVYENYVELYDHSESPSKLIGKIGQGSRFKTYRGSASKESYDHQGKNSDWRTAEGVSTKVPYKGSVESIIKDIEGGIRSSMTYTGSKNLKEFKERSEFIRVSDSTKIENTPHKLK